jgi:hypothetical protein
VFSKICIIFQYYFMYGDFMKRILFAIAIICSPLAAFDGFYVGGGIGGHLAEGVQNGATLGTQAVGDAVSSYSVDLHQNSFDHGVAGILYAGYGFSWHSFHLAAEGFVQFGSAHLKTSRNDISESDNVPELFAVPTDVDAHIRCCQYGIDFLPGWSPNAMTLFYGRIGVSAARTNL